MRTFEALACGKPFLAAHSDAYERLGLVHGEHLAIVRDAQETLQWADRLLGEAGKSIAKAGSRAVLEYHTYGHRLATITSVICPKIVAPRAVVENPKEDGPSGIALMTYNKEVLQMEERLNALPLDAETRDLVCALAHEHDNANMRYPELLSLAAAMLSFPRSNQVLKESASSEKTCEKAKKSAGNFPNACLVQHPPKVQFVCEIGTFHGVTAAFLGRLADLLGLPCPVLSVDSFESPYLAHLPDRSSHYYDAMATYGLLARRNSLIAMRSGPAAAYVPNGIGLLLIDGGHDYEICQQDLLLYLPKMAPGGVVAVDDVWYESVRRACDEFPWRNAGFVVETALQKIELYRRSAVPA
jgi:hypothetical protein